ncbi:MAG TPA: VOC family protein [Lacunisphaera sp.]|nr:VOC family protein [Lacunisphaera sp.]
MNRIFDHIDLRVARLADCEAFYGAFLPLLGFVERVRIDGWLQFESAGPGPSAFFGVTEEAGHQPNRNRIAFWAESKERVDELSARLRALGARQVDGPEFVDPTYYAVYFDDPSGNPMEICFRSKRFNEA